MSKLIGQCSFTAVLIAFLLIGCKVEITVPPGGRVTTLGGSLVCDEGQTCTLEDDRGYFREFLLAVPAPGYVFAKWKNVARGLCRNRTMHCELDSTEFDHIPALNRIFWSDEIFYLEPLFIQRAKMATFTPLGDIPGGSYQSVGIGLSADGSTAVGWSRSGDSHRSEMQAYRWTAIEGMVALGDLPGPSIESYAYDASNDGSVVVGYGTTSEAVANASAAAEAFYWTAGSGLIGIGDLPGGHFASHASAVSNSGNIIVGYSASGVADMFEAFRWTAQGGMVGLGDLPGGLFWSLAYDISGNGKVIVGSGDSASGEEAFRWTETEGMVALGDLPGGRKRSVANAVSHDGSVVVGSSDVGYSNGVSTKAVFRWTKADGMVALSKDAKGTVGPGPTGISGDGRVIVGTLDNEAFIWTNTHGYRPLKDVLIAQGATELVEWRLDSVGSISGDGRTIVGTGVGPNGGEAWIATFNPGFPAW